MSGFVNGLFLVFIAISIFVEAVKRILSPPEILTEKLLLVAVAGIQSFIKLFTY